MNYIFPFNEIFYIYKITNTINSKIYIGRTKNPSYRKRSHINATKNTILNMQKIHIAMNELGLINFTFEVFEKCEDYAFACEREIYWINFYHSDDENFGYNDKCGLLGNPILTEEHYKKISLNMKGEKNHRFGKTLSNDEVQNLSMQFSGSGNPFYGKTHSDETKEIISLSSKGRILGENNPRAKLNVEIVSKIREDWITGNYTKVMLGKKYNVTAATIGNIVSGKTWK